MYLGDFSQIVNLSVRYEIEIIYDAMVLLPLKDSSRGMQNRSRVARHVVQRSLATPYPAGSPLALSCLPLVPRSLNFCGFRSRPPRIFVPRSLGVARDR